MTLAAPGDRAALLMPQGLDYVAAFLGCLYARVIAVPLFSPRLPGHAGALAAVLADCEPGCLLTDSATVIAVDAFVLDHALPAVPVVPVDRLPLQRFAFDEVESAPVPDDIAYLQYTSGSTRDPAGAMISHANVVANARQAIDAFAGDLDDPGATTTVGWLPLFHDMGLVLSVAAPVLGGFPSVLMDPAAFLENPGAGCACWARTTARSAPPPTSRTTIPRGPHRPRPGRRAAPGPRTRPDQRRRAGAAGHHRPLPCRLRTRGPRPGGALSRVRARQATVLTADAPAAEPTTVACDAGALAEGRIESAQDGAGARPVCVLRRARRPGGADRRRRGRRAVSGAGR